VRIVVTRPREQADRLVSRLAELGHEVVVVPLIAAQPLGDGPVDVEGYDWVIVTSRTAASELARRRVGGLGRVAAIGPGTAEELEANGIRPTLVARVSTQEGLLAELPRPTGRVLFAGAEDARTLLVDELGADVVHLYRTVAVMPTVPVEGDLVVLASPSAARALADLRRDLPCVSIGPQTTAAARAAGLEVLREAETSDLEGLVAAVRSAACSSAS
jgi:uroporphyrinogen-III synthase